MKEITQKSCGDFFLIAIVITLFFHQPMLCVFKIVVGKILPK